MNEHPEGASRLTTLSATPPWPAASEWAAALDAATSLAIRYLSTLPESHVSHHATPQDMAPRFDSPLPDDGCAPADAVHEWFERAERGIVRSPGPRYFGFVTGGATPAALAGDWLASALDQNAAAWLMSPAAAQTELTAVRWLLELFGLPQGWSGTLTSGATMSNLSGLAAGRQWVSHRLGFDAARDGLGGRPAIPVLGSTETHQSALKALGTLGLGRGSLHAVQATDGAIELDAFDATLSRFDGPVIVIANAGEVNTGAFDNILAMADRCRAYQPGAWLHVDGAFGLYAALSPASAHLLQGIDQADSVATDAHKWLNVPYDCGAVFVRDGSILREAFSGTAPYLRSDQDDQAWNAFEHIPEFSRRFRALAVWCALRASGKNGYRAIVSRCLANAQSFATWVDQTVELELLSPPHLNIVCFRLIEAGRDEQSNDALTTAVVDRIQRDGLAYVTGTRWRGHAAIRAAFDNWATSERDVDILKDGVAQALDSVLRARESTPGF